MQPKRMYPSPEEPWGIHPLPPTNHQTWCLSEERGAFDCAVFPYQVVAPDQPAVALTSDRAVKEESLVSYE